MSVTRNAYWRSRKGVHFENLAKQWLCRQGLEVLHSNYHCKCGEIDLVMADAATLVFVEVRYRGNQLFGGPLATVTAAKQQRLRNTARHFLMMHPQYRQAPCRFDVIGISGKGRDQYGINWIRNAFY